MGRRGEDLTGRRFGRWLVLHRVNTGKRRDSGLRWMCRCDCGTEKSVAYLNATERAPSLSCGCHRRDPAFIEERRAKMRYEKKLRAENETLRRLGVKF